MKCIYVFFLYWNENKRSQLTIYNTMSIKESIKNKKKLLLHEACNWYISLACYIKTEAELSLFKL